MRKLLLTSFFVLAIGTLLPVAAQDTPQLVSIQTLEEIIGDHYSREVVHTAKLSPDGSKIIWWGSDEENDELCIYKFEPDTTTCYPLNVGYSGGAQALIWSPDSAKAAFTEDVFNRLEDADIWVFDVATGSVLNHTEDNYSDTLPRITGNEPETVYIDYNPIWHPITSELYFLRTEPDDTRDIPWTLALYRLNADGQAELVHNFSEIPGLSIYTPLVNVFLDGAMSFTPDGSQLAIFVGGIVEAHPVKGIWLLDMVNLSEPYQIHAAFVLDGIPRSKENGMRISTIGWAGENILIFSTIDVGGPGVDIYANVYALDIATSEVTPLVDFSGIEEVEDIFTKEDLLGYLPLFYAPRSAVVLANNTLVAMNGFQDKRGISIARFPSDNAALTLIAPIPNFQPYPARTSSASSDGKVLLGGYLLTFNME